jgi:RNA polymerase sigma factor (sigma-70 family)
MSRIPSYKFLEKSFDPRDLERFTNEEGLWYESPEEVEDGVKRGTRQARRLALLVKLMDECLTRAQCTCTKLYYLEGKSLREIAAITGIHFTTVHQHVHAAIKRLRREARPLAGHGCRKQLNA